MNDIINNAPTVLAPLVLAFLMISLGLRLTTDDFLRVVKIPKAFGVGRRYPIVNKFNISILPEGRNSLDSIKAGISENIQVNKVV